MANGPAPFSEIGKRARDLLYKDYNFDHKFSLSVPNSAGLGLIATGLKKDQIFVGDINTLYKSGNVTVDVKVDTYSNVSTKVTVNDIFHSNKVALSFNIPDHKSGKLDVQYLHPHAAIDSSIGLNPSPQLELSAAIGSKELCMGAEVGFNTTSSSFTKYNAGIAFNKSDFSAALMLFTIGSSQSLDPITVLKTRFSDDGKAAFQCQRAWRPNSLITLSAEYDSTKIFSSSTKFGLALTLKP
ncbi:Porin domain superfamily [Sesbania bispinosa]|nr:Porin domain superfamily [Sesbania bispinosa]